MILAVDIGNSNITLGGYEADRLVLSARLATIKHRTADQHAIELKTLFDLHGLDVRQVDGAIIGSVVPVVSEAMKQGMQTVFGITPLVLGPGVKTGVNIRIDNPAQLGADLAAGAAGAIGKYPTPCIVFDLGTAITASVIGEHGDFLGGTISAGLAMSLEALATKTANLPYISLDAPPSVIGTNTVDSMRAGLVIGVAAMLDGMTERIEEELGQSATVIATGGLARNVVQYCKRPMILDENLLLDGLRMIYEKNKK